MKGQAKRFVNHKGKMHDMGLKPKPEKEDEIGFLDLWRYATPLERCGTLLGVVVSWGASGALIAAVVLYGELTSLFVARHRAVTAAAPPLLALFNGGRVLPDGNRSLHMDALVEDSIAFGAASVVVMLVQLSCAALAVTLANRAAASMVNRLRWQLLRAVIRQEIAFFDTNTSMDFASTLTDDMEKLRAGVGEHVVMTSYLAGTVVIGASLSLSYGWLLTLVGLAVIPLALIVAATVSKYQTRCGAREAAAYGAASRVVEEALRNITTVRAYAGERTELQLYTKALRVGEVEARRRGVVAGAGAGLGWTLTYTLNATVLAAGAALIVRDMPLPTHEQTYTPGVMLTILFCTFMAAQNISMCQPHLEVFAAARGAARQVFRLLRRRPRIDALDDAGIKPPGFRGDIEFRDVYFNYPSRPDVKVLRGLNLTIKAGETVALVGGSGCGKSTVLQLLQRMYDPDSGAVTVDGHPLKDLNLHHYRTNIGVVGQEPVLFSGTIRENITLGLDDVSEEQLVSAAETANAHQFIMSLASGYDTVLGSSVSLSGGQKQRVCVARGVARRGAILLLDEPSAALDARSEAALHRALLTDRTTLIVSHRLSTIVNAHRIVYMEHGAVVEQGTHLELLEKRGAYWTLLQQDLTNRSIAENKILEGSQDDDDDVVAESPEKRARSVSRQSSCRSSIIRESALRGSRRFGSVSPHTHTLTQCAPDTEHVEYQDPQSDPSEKEPPSVSMWSLVKLNAAEWPLLVGGGVASLLVGATMPAFALLFSKLYGMFAMSDGEAILRDSMRYAGMFGGVAAVCGAVTFLQTALFNRAGARLTDRLRVMVFHNYLQQEQGWHDSPQNSVGALCARLSTDAAAVQGATGTRLGTVLQGVSTMLLGVGLSLAYSWKMTLVSLLSVPCVIGGIYVEGVMTRRTESRQRAATEQACRVATETITNLRTVHSLGVESCMLSRYTAALDSARAGGGWVRGCVYGVCLCAPTLGYTVSLAYGGYLVAREGLRYEYAILVSEALIYGAWMLAEALSFAPSFAAARRSGARIIQALSRTPAILSPATLPADGDQHWRPVGAVSLSDVHFRYPTRPAASVLRGLTLSVEPGHTLALVGPSGCGKSTALHLLLRDYLPERGRVLVDGRDVASLPLHKLRGSMALVQQEPALFARSLRDNIAYGDLCSQASMQQVIAAAQQANVHAFIASLPAGYDTVLGPGVSLSGGQKQRVGIARALLREPSILLLDEPTSALDANSELIVQSALEAATRGRTTIMIAHRLATVRHAHCICVVDKGVVVESGTHDELVERRGLYWQLLQQQGK